MPMPISFFSSPSPSSDTPPAHQQLLRLLVEHLECTKATARQNYDFLILQATENSIPFYESMGFVRVGCVQGKAASPDAYVSNPVFEYHTERNGETPSTIATDFGVDAWDVVFLNRPIHGEYLVQRSWLRSGTKMFVPKADRLPVGGAAPRAAPLPPKWYAAEEDETPRGIARKFGVDFAELLRANRRRYPDLVGHSRLLGGTRVQVSRFHVHEGSDSIAYSHWTFPDAEGDDGDASYMMAMRLDRKRGLQARERPVADSLAVAIQPYDPEGCGVKDLLLQPQKAQAPLAPVFANKPTPREPQKPKRPVTSYAHFSLDARASMKLEGMPIIDVNKILSEKWMAMSDEDKKPYLEKYEESKAEHMGAMKKYEADMARFQREGPHIIPISAMTPPLPILCYNCRICKLDCNAASNVKGSCIQCHVEGVECLFPPPPNIIKHGSSSHHGCSLFQKNCVQCTITHRRCVFDANNHYRR